MTSRPIITAILAIVAVATFSCSKTQDTAPERRVFGDPPTIEHVDDASNNFYEESHFTQCDFSEIMKTFFCTLGGPPDTEFHEGNGWRLGNAPPISPPSAVPGVFIEGTYGQIILRAKVSDPNSPPPPAQSNILLVSASFHDPPGSNTETSLVLFDDGSFNKFQFPQKVTRVGEDCEIDAFGTCVCHGAKYSVKSGDETTADGFFTRKLAILDRLTVNGQASEFLQDCILRETSATPYIATRGDVYEYKIEAVDRQGNLTGWPALLRAVVGVSSFDCNGDPCGCCFLQANLPSEECAGLEGSTSSSFPDGLCKFFGP